MSDKIDEVLTATAIMPRTQRENRTPPAGVGVLPTTELPSSPEAEQAILGAMVLDAEAIDTAVHDLRPEHFFLEAHATLFAVIADLHQKQLPVDITNLVAELKLRRLLDKVGGPDYVASLPAQVFSVASIDHYIAQVRETYEKRELLRLAEQIRHHVFESHRDVPGVIELVERQLFELSLKREAREFLSTSDLMPAVLEELEKRRTEAHSPRGVITGFPDLDAMTGGLQPSDLIILAARPSVGKTALAMNIALNVGAGRTKAMRANLGLARPVGIFSLEMSAQQITQRLLATLSRISLKLLRHHRLTDRQKAEVEKASQSLAEAPIFIDDTPYLTIVELRSKARRLKGRVPELALIVVDYLQLMHVGGRVENRQQEVAEITRSLKALARELDVPVLALSQLSRQVEQRKGRKARPMLSDLRESGAIEQDADIVMFIHRDRNEQSERYEDEDGKKNLAPVPTELIIAKHRNGPIGTVELLFFPHLTMFASPYRGTDEHDDEKDLGY
ncbi:MAG: replicative DNA helicase [Candidatus Sumerlaeaceae bacterium]|jgi:replicative DNA helicase